MSVLTRTACLAAGAAIAALVVAAPLPAHDHATGIVKERMDGMESIGKVMKAIDQRIKAKRDLAPIAKDALRVQEIAAKMLSWFPPGSNQEPSEAKAAIWEHWADFEAKARALQIESGKLVSVAASGDPKAVAAQFRVVSRVCAECHETFRVKK